MGNSSLVLVKVVLLMIMMVAIMMIVVLRWKEFWLLCFPTMQGSKKKIDRVFLLLILLLVVRLILVSSYLLLSIKTILVYSCDARIPLNVLNAWTIDQSPACHSWPTWSLYPPSSPQITWLLKAWKLDFALFYLLFFLLLIDYSLLMDRLGLRTQKTYWSFYVPTTGLPKYVPHDPSFTPSPPEHTHFLCLIPLERAS